MSRGVCPSPSISFKQIFCCDSNIRTRSTFCRQTAGIAIKQNHALHILLRRSPPWPCRREKEPTGEEGCASCRQIPLANASAAQPDSMLARSLRRPECGRLMVDLVLVSSAADDFERSHVTACASAPAIPLPFMQLTLASSLQWRRHCWRDTTRA
jgi:hypothetical protein